MIQYLGGTHEQKASPHKSPSAKIEYVVEMLFKTQKLNIRYPISFTKLRQIENCVERFCSPKWYDSNCRTD